MNQRDSIIAFVSVLLAIAYLATIAAVLAWYERYAEALGFGGITTGLVGVIGTFRPRAMSSDMGSGVTPVSRVGEEDSAS